jgi:hypothetical protein
MPVPLTMTEPGLEGLMVLSLGTVATALEWNELSPSLDEAVTDALILVGASDILTVTDIAKLRAAGRLCAWRMAAGAVAGMVTFAADGLSISLSDLQRATSAGLVQAERDAADHGIAPAMMARIDHVRWRHDPYAVLDDAVRTLP